MTTLYRTGDLVVCITDGYNTIAYETIGVVTSVPHSFALVNCDFNGVRGAFPSHEIMHLDRWQHFQDREVICE